MTTSRLMPSSVARRFRVRQQGNPQTVVKDGGRVSISHLEIATRVVETSISGEALRLAHRLLGNTSKRMNAPLSSDDVDQLRENLLLAPAARVLDYKRGLFEGVGKGRRLAFYEDFAALRSTLGRAFECGSYGVETDVDDLLPGDMLSPLIGLDFDGGILYNGHNLGRNGALNPLFSSVLNYAFSCPGLSQRVFGMTSDKEDELGFLYIRKKLESNYGINQRIYQTMVLMMIYKLLFQEAGVPSRIIQGYEAPIRTGNVAWDDRAEKSVIEFEAEDGAVWILDPERDRLFEKGEAIDANERWESGRPVEMYRIGRTDFAFAYPGRYQNRIFRPASYLTDGVYEIISTRAGRHQHDRTLSLPGISNRYVFGRIMQAGSPRENQDNALLATNGEVMLLMVADGVKVADASSWATRATETAFRDGGDDRLILQNAFFDVWENNMSDPEAWEPNFRPARSTAVIVLTTPRMHYVAHTGDSRAFLVRDGRVLHLTKDHNVAGYGVENDNPSLELPFDLTGSRVFDPYDRSEKRAPYHEVVRMDRANRILTQDLEMDPPADMGANFSIENRPGDAILLFSDWINVLSPYELESIILGNVGNGAEALVQALSAEARRKSEDHATTLALCPGQARGIT